MIKNRKHERLSLITFAESEIFSAEILNKNINISKKDLIPQEFFLVFDIDTEESVGYLIDISLGGLLLIAYRPFENNAHYSFRMDFSPILDYKHKMEFEVRCAWAINNSEIECNITGFEFINISDENIEIINSVINKYSAIKIL